MSEPVAVQVRVKVQKRKSGRPLSKALMQEAVQVWADSGEAPKGFTIEAVTWFNYARESQAPKTASDPEGIEEARRTLHLGELFREIPPTITGEGLATPEEEEAREVEIGQVGEGEGEGRRKKATPRRRRKKRGARRKKTHARTAKSRRARPHSKAKKRMGKNRAKRGRPRLARRSKNKRKAKARRTSRRRGNKR